jgi:hypothetical protein
MKPFASAGLFAPGPVIAGLDLGKSADYSALVPLRKVGMTADAGHRPMPVYTCAAVKRWPLGTSYTAVVADVVRLFEGRGYAGGDLVIDGTGVGAGVVDAFRHARPRATVHAVVLTGGHAETRRPHNTRHVSKVILIHTALMAVLQGRVKFARRIPEAAVIRRELSGYTLKVSPSANEIYEARDCEHDDLVLALCLAVYFGDRRGVEAQFEVLDPAEAEGPAADEMSEEAKARLPEGPLWPGGPTPDEYQAELDRLMAEPPRFSDDPERLDGWDGWR